MLWIFESCGCMQLFVFRVTDPELGEFIQKQYQTKKKKKAAVQPSDERKAIATLVPALCPITCWAVQQSVVLLIPLPLCHSSAGAEPVLLYIYYFHYFSLVWWSFSGCNLL